MLEELLKSVPVYVFSMVKFIFGPTAGFAAGLHFVTTVLVTVAGMMTVVVALTYFGDYLIKTFRKQTPPKAAANNSRWKKYGLPGIAFLTPLLLTPVGGTLLALGSGSSREKIIFFMFVSAAGWSVAFTSVVYFLGEKVLEVLPEFAR
ncbi:MAG: hypothetical protein JST14_18110 [Bacteroidetes bacterium]|nr:hypothetical protein [Bacteroidota bacterium]